MPPCFFIWDGVINWIIWCRKCSLLPVFPPHAYSRFSSQNHLWSCFWLNRSTGVATCVATCVALGDIGGSSWRTLTWDISIRRMDLSSASCCLTWGLRCHPASMPQDWAMDCRLQPSPGTEEFSGGYSVACKGWLQAISWSVSQIIHVKWWGVNWYFVWTLDVAWYLYSEPYIFLINFLCAEQSPLAGVNKSCVNEAAEVRYRSRNKYK